MKRYYLFIVVMDKGRLVASYKEAHWKLEDALISKRKVLDKANRDGNDANVYVAADPMLN